MKTAWQLFLGAGAMCAIGVVAWQFANFFYHLARIGCP